jgi:hypothetical protein
VDNQEHRYYDLARRAHAGTSFVPEKRAAQDVADFDAMMASLEEKGATSADLARVEKAWVAWMNSRTRIVSTMIAGGSNFPVERMRKRNEAEHRRYDAFDAVHNAIAERLRSEAYYAEHPEARPIAISDADAVQRLDARLATLQAALDEVLQRRANGKLEHAFEVQYARKAIKTAQEQRARAVAAQAVMAATPEIAFEGGVIRIEEERVQIDFDAKPSADMITKLKSRAFKWSPKRGTWVRQYTVNALAVAKWIVGVTP